MVGAKRPHEVHLLGSAHGCDLGAERLGDLDRERPDVPRRTIDEDLVARCWRPAVPQPQPLHGEDRGMWECCSVLERHAVRDREKTLLGGACVLGEGTLAVRVEVAVHPVAGPKANHVRPDGLDPARCVQADPGFRGLRSPMMARTNAGRGWMPSRSARLTDAAKTRTRT